MSDVTFYPHCNPITSNYDFKGTFASPEDAITYARWLGSNVVQRNGDSDTYTISHITKVSDYGVLKYAFGKNVGRDCHCAVTRRSRHHQKDELHGGCIDPFPLLGGIEHLFMPLPESVRGHTSAVWLIDSYKMVTVGGAALAAIAAAEAAVAAAAAVSAQPEAAEAAAAAKAAAEALKAAVELKAAEVVDPEARESYRDAAVKKYAREKLAKELAKEEVISAVVVA